MNATNVSSVHSVEFFVFTGLSNEKDLFPLPFLLSLLLYVMNVGGTVIFLMLIIQDRSLHTPMYYFICDLAVIDIAVSSTVTPKVAANILSEIKTISYWGCIAQMGCLYFFTSLESSVLLLMAYDRYVAICRPLHYPSIMTNVYMFKLLSATWAISLTYMKQRRRANATHLCTLTTSSDATLLFVSRWQHDRKFKSLTRRREIDESRLESPDEIRKVGLYCVVRFARFDSILSPLQIIHWNPSYLVNWESRTTVVIYQY
ncbi:LOW QUALITY PROTEIN: olfactory receptor 4K15-like [Latimeria chalumnae]|uniref:LOW QUALITY PROTEIN: olfactory receptor 4K15-like n=1 Tax=Latimeria chalumnae TaxID=7897 RepID=UPI00313E461E